MKKWKVVPALLAVLGLTFALTACGQKAKPTTSSRPLTGFYKEENSAEDGTDKPFYWYFKKDGTVLCCSPEVESTNSNSDAESWYGVAKRGTWKSVGGNEYELKLHDIYDHDHYLLAAQLKGKQIHITDSEDDSKYQWGDSDISQQKGMTAAAYMEMFNKAKVSDQEGIQADGYIKADSDDSDSSSASSSSASADPNEIGRAIYRRVFPSEEVDSVEQDGDSYVVSNEYHSAESTIKFQINGDTVTYWTQAAGDTTADGHNEEHTVSISDLLGK